MEADAIVQLVTIVVTAMGIVWHQQHSTNQLRSEFREDNRQLREDFNTANRELREDFKVLRDDHDKLRDAVAQNGQRLARIEGHLGIGIP
ncbi:MAG: hypothetical protein OXH78_02920, partial [Acidimicrobiaceae bacterium]|nr:hypothetical protein [Acidimicrobiaceae bacterium]